MNLRSFRHNAIILANLLITGMLVISFSKSYATNAPSEVLSSKTSQPTYSDQLLNTTAQKINQIRSANNLQSMSEDNELDKLAQARADDMSNNNYYSHLDSQKHYFDYYLKNSNYSYNFACENLNISDSTDPNIFVDGWMNSKTGHKECILKPSHTRYGYAVTKIKSSGNYTFNTEETVIVAIYSD